MDGLFSVVVTKFFEIAVGKIVEGMFKCDRCDEEKNTKIENISYNWFECPNCSKDSRQFSCATANTVSKSGKLSQIGVSFIGDIDDEDDESRLRGQYIFDGLLGQQIVETGRLLDFNNNQLLSIEQTIWLPESSYDVRSMFQRAPHKDMPEFDEYWKTYAFEFELRNKWGDVMLLDRHIAKL